jgi:predicted MFS family arabinose efflux permease
VTSPLRSSRLRRIIAAYTINRLGTWFGLLALLLAVFEHTHSAIAVAALLFAGQALPAFIVPAVVARVEASNHRGELSALYLFEGVVTAALAVLLWYFWLPAVLLLAALDGTAALAASALLRAELARAARGQATARTGVERAQNDPETVAQEAERKANAALNIAFSGTFVLGPALAGAVVAAAGAPTALFIDTGSFLLCGALLIDLHPHVEDAGGNSVGARLRTAWKHINETPSLRGLLLLDGLAFVFFEAAPPIEVIYAKTTLHAGDRGLGLLLTSWGAGAVVGSVIFARSQRRPLGALLSGGTLAVGLAYVGFAAAPSLLLACLAALIGGIGNGVELPSLISIVQRMTPPNLHGRLMGAVESLGALCIAIGLPMGGALVALGSPRPAFLVIGLGAVVTAGALMRLSAAALRPQAGSSEDDPAAPASTRALGESLPR